MIPKEQALGLRALVCGVDGVLTNGAIGYSSLNTEIHFFDARDGLATRLACWHGLKIAWISGRLSNHIAQRARDLDVPFYPGYANKEAGLRIIARDFELDLNEIAYIGDDLNDLLAFRIAGYPIAVASAPVEVQQKARYVTRASGGQGAVREAIEAILHAQGGWEAAVENYLHVLREPARMEHIGRRLPRTEE